MLKNIIGRFFGATPPASTPQTSDRDRWEASLIERIREMSPKDPLIGAKLVGKELAPRLIEAMTVNGGVHVESLMCAAGALAGYSCQATVRANNRRQGLEELAGLSVATAQDGQTFIFGDPLNRHVAEGEMSVWSLSAGGAQACGCGSLLDLNDVFAHVAQTVGTGGFGVPRLPEGHPVHEQPQTYLVRLWPTFAPMVERFCPEPDHWPIAYGIAIQELLAKTKAVLDPCLALRVVMESAIPMSKVQLRAA